MTTSEIPPMPEQAPVMPYSLEDFIPLEDVEERNQVSLEARASLRDAVIPDVNPPELSKERKLKPEQIEANKEAQKAYDAKFSKVTADLLGAVTTALAPLGREATSSLDHNGLPMFTVTDNPRMRAYKEKLAREADVDFTPYAYTISAVRSFRALRRSAVAAIGEMHSDTDRLLLKPEVESPAVSAQTSEETAPTPAEGKAAIVVPEVPTRDSVKALVNTLNHYGFGLKAKQNGSIDVYHKGGESPGELVISLENLTKGTAENALGLLALFGYEEPENPSV